MDLSELASILDISETDKIYDDSLHHLTSLVLW
jgi:hypothetical protein